MQGLQGNGRRHVPCLPISGAFSQQRMIPSVGGYAVIGCKLQVVMRTANTCASLAGFFTSFIAVGSTLYNVRSMLANSRTNRSTIDEAQIPLRRLPQKFPVTHVTGKSATSRTNQRGRHGFVADVTA